STRAHLSPAERAERRARVEAYRARMEERRRLVREVASESARLSALGFSRETIADAAEFATRWVAVFGGSVSLLTFTVRAEDGREFDCRAEVTGSGPNRCARQIGRASCRERV